jgi:hypothetical protein
MVQRYLARKVRKGSYLVREMGRAVHDTLMTASLETGEFFLSILKYKYFLK